MEASQVFASMGDSRLGVVAAMWLSCIVVVMVGGGHGCLALG